MLKKFTMLVSTIAFSTSMVFGSGFSIYEQGAKATAMGGAFIAQANDVSGVFYNPAGITGLEGFNMGLGTTIIVPSFAFQGPNSVDDNLYTEAEPLVFPPSTFYATYSVNDRLALGFGFYTLFGLGSEWPSDWEGRELATNSHVQTFFLNPNVAYKVMDNLSVAVGVSAVIASVTLEKSIYSPLDVYIESKLDASTVGWGFNVGLQYKPAKEMTVGFVYRHNVELDFEDGDASFTIPQVTNESVNALHAGLFPDTKGSSALTLPNMIGVGVAYDFTKQLTAEFDWVQLGWSSYDKLIINFDDEVAGSSESEAVRNYEDSFSLRFGLEYRVDDQLALRLGYIRDNKAVPDDYLEPSLPEGDRNLYSIGLGYKVNAFTIDGYYMLLTQDDRDISTSKIEVNGAPRPFNGTYTGIGNLFGVSFGYAIK